MAKELRRSAAFSGRPRDRTNAGHARRKLHGGRFRRSRMKALCSSETGGGVRGFGERQQYRKLDRLRLGNVDGGGGGLLGFRPWLSYRCPAPRAVAPRRKSDTTMGGINLHAQSDVDGRFIQTCSPTGRLFRSIKHRLNDQSIWPVRAARILAGLSYDPIVGRLPGNNLRHRRTSTQYQAESCARKCTMASYIGS